MQITIVAKRSALGIVRVGAYHGTLNDKTRAKIERIIRKDDARAKAVSFTEIECLDPIDPPDLVMV